MANLKSKRTSKAQLTTIIILVLAFALVGYYIIRSKAAAPAAAIEADGTPTSPAVSLNDTTASGSKVTQFKSGSSGTYYVIGSGDIGKGSPAAKPTGDQIKNLSPAADAVFTTGDDAYSDGAPSDFTNNYEPYWGSFKSKTYPSPGNHDYHTSGASGYYAYFNATATTITGHTVDGVPNKGYYAWNLGTKWRFYSLNSEVNITEANSWLAADMKAHPERTCSVAYWHQPPFTTGNHGPNKTMQSTYFKTLYDNGGDIVLTGHNHSYERFVPLNPSGVRDDTKGILSIVVGTGGDLPGYAVGSPGGTLVKSATNILGNLLLTIKDDGTYKYDFLKASGPTNFSDSGTGVCH